MRSLSSEIEIKGEGREGGVQGRGKEERGKGEGGKRGREKRGERGV